LTIAADTAASPAVAAKCSVATNTSNATTGAATVKGGVTGVVASAVGNFGDVFSVGIVNSTVGTQTTLLRWGVQTTTAASASSELGVAAAGFHSYNWTKPGATQFAAYTAITTAESKTMTGQSAAPAGSMLDYEDGTTKVRVAEGTNITTGTEATCGTEWATTANSCAGVSKWGVGTLTDAVTGTSTGSVQAWMWLADVNPNTPSAVFGVEKDDVIQIVVHQQTGW